ncbi:tol protein [Stagonosporopsis vannaccii]|nr:tol protein [Stagonosporopsis vannaccii]
MVDWPAKPKLTVFDADSEHFSKLIDRLHPRTLDLHKIKAWIGRCQNQHRYHCSLHPQDDLKELKVIDCIEERVVDAPSHCQYVALSYVWGDVNDDSSGRASTCLKSSPRTIADAMKLTKDLGYQFLWVDRYCIPQDDADTQHVQIAQMGKVYAAAALTIMAAIGNNPHHGLPGLSHPRTIRAETLESSSVVVLPPVSDFEQIKQSTWSKRAWTLQESVLSKRRLILTNRQAIFFCNADVCFETGSEMEKVISSMPGWEPPQVSTHPMTTARNYLEDYSRRSLSYETDALNAIVGALNILRKDRVYHVWGVPFHHVEHVPYEAPELRTHTGRLYAFEWVPNMALLWSHKQLAKRRLGFPSWSPLGWIGEVHFEDDLLALKLHHITIRTRAGRQDLLLFKPDPDTLPEKTWQQLELHGETYPVPLANKNGVALPYGRDLYYMIPVSWSVSDTESLQGVKALLVRQSLMSDDPDLLLILRPCEGEGTRCYERIGLAKLPRPESNPLDEGVGCERWLDMDLQPVRRTGTSDATVAASRARPPTQYWWRDHFCSELVTLV